jgi:hypothetical protein
MSHDDRDLAYLAGVVDSDGSINIVRGKPYGVQKAPRHRLRIDIAQLERGAIDLAYSLFGGYMSHEKANLLLRRPNQLYHWYVDDARAASMLEAIRPYLRNKQQQAWLGLEYWANWVMHNPLRPEDIALRDGFWLAMKTAHAVGI